ncbi:MAG: prealbumin-like fold domain-containing protein, partial [Candidatus Limnocylindrales bacterium]
GPIPPVGGGGGVPPFPGPIPPIQPGGGGVSPGAGGGNFCVWWSCWIYNSFQFVFNTFNFFINPFSPPPSSNTGTLTITKVAVNGTVGTFNFTVVSGNDASKKYNASITLPNNSTTVSGLDNDTPWLISETQDTASGWVLTDTSQNCQQSVYFAQNDESQTCTFTNTKSTTPQPSSTTSLTIVKKIDQYQPGQDDTFTFNVSNTTGTDTFSPTPLTTSGGTISQTFSNIGSGFYSVTEYDQPGWSFENAVCTNQTGATVASSVQGGASEVSSFSINAGDQITCTFKDIKLAKLTIVKNIASYQPNQPNQDGTFTFNITNSTYDATVTTKGGTGTSDPVYLDPNITYSIDEADNSGWALQPPAPGSYERCYVQGTGRIGTNTATGVKNIRPKSGENIACTFTNKKSTTSLTIAKKIDQYQPGQDGTFTFDVRNTDSASIPVQNVTVDTSKGVNGTATSAPITGIVSGNYNISENIPTGWTLESAVCTKSGAAVGVQTSNGLSGIVINTGDQITCTFTNKKQASITVGKTAEGGESNGQAAFTFSATNSSQRGSNSCTVNIDFDINGNGKGSCVIDGLASGIPWTINETSPSGWQETVRTNPTCNGVTLSPGENQKCTITDVYTPPGSAGNPPSGGGTGTGTEQRQFFGQ